MRYLYVLLVALFTLIGCQEKSVVNTDLIQQIPTDSKIIVTTNDPSNLMQLLENSSLVDFQKIQRVQEIQKAASFLSHYDINESSLIAFSPEGKKDFAITLITQPIDSLALTDVNNKAHTYNNSSYTHTTAQKHEWYHTNYNGNHIATTSRLVLESLLRRNLDDYIFNAEFKKVYERTTGSDFNIYINASNNHHLLDFLSIKAHKDTPADFGYWYQLEPRTGDHSIEMDGIITYADSAVHFNSLFNRLTPQENQFAQIIPANALGARIFTYGSATEVQQSLNDYHQQTKKLDPNIQSILENSYEATRIDLSSGRGIAFSLKPYEHFFMDLDSLFSTKFTYRDFYVYEMQGDITTSSMYPLLPHANFDHISVIGDFLVIANHQKVLEELIANYQNKSVLANQGWWEKTAASLSSNSTLVYIDSKSKLTQSFGTKDQKVLSQVSKEQFPLSISQYVHEPTYAHYRYIIPNATGVENQKGITQIANISSESTVIAGPYFFPNHITGKPDIAFQDESLQLHLYSYKGEKYWSKQLDHEILGGIQSIDGYKNGRKQLLFSTTHAVHYLDRNGNDLNAYPITFKEPLAQPVSIFDYDNNRNYRILVSEANGALTMYDIEGKTVKGFKYKKKATPITQPKHFRVKGKDYIAFARSDNSLALLHRTGKTRTKVTEELSIKGALFLDNNLIKTIVKDQIIYIDPTTGAVTQTGQQVPTDAAYVLKKGIEIIQDNNELTINGTKTTLPYGTYAPIQLDVVDRSKLLHTVDLGGHQLYLLDSTGKIVEGFPIYGTEVSTIMNRKGTYIATRDGNDVIVYQF